MRLPRARRRSGRGQVVPLRADGTFETDELRPGDWQVAWRSMTAVSAGSIDFRRHSGQERAELWKWMLARIGSFLSLSPESPVLINGLPPGMYEVRLGSESATAAVTAGSTATVDLR